MSVKTDFSLICATNVDVAQAVADGRLRQDLYFRLNTIALSVPPLRERGGDVHLLASRFLRRFAAAHGRPLLGFTDQVRQILDEYAVARERPRARARRRAGGDPGRRATHRGGGPASGLAPGAGATGGGSVRAGGLLAESGALAILQTLELTDWNKRQAAKILGIHRPTLYNKLRRYRLGAVRIASAATRSIDRARA